MGWLWDSLGQDHKAQTAMAWSSCTHKNPKGYLLWVAMPAPPTIRAKEEMERHHPERPEWHKYGWEWMVWRGYYIKGCMEGILWSWSWKLQRTNDYWTINTCSSASYLWGVQWNLPLRKWQAARDTNAQLRRKPVWEQKGAVQCVACSHWFRSKGGLTVHTCSPGS